MTVREEIQGRLKTRRSFRTLTVRYLRRIIWFLIIGTWGPVIALPAIAAVLPGPVSALVDPSDVPAIMLILALVISSLSGGTALLMRIDRELSQAPEKPLSRPWLMAAAHMAGAWLAGAAAFIGAQQMSVAAWGTLGSVLVASFANAKFLESLVEKLPWARERQSNGSGPTA